MTEIQCVSGPYCVAGSGAYGVRLVGPFLSGPAGFPRLGARLIETGPKGLPALSGLDFHP
jgi:hypothetical protein